MFSSENRLVCGVCVLYIYIFVTTLEVVCVFLGREIGVAVSVCAKCS